MITRSFRTITGLCAAAALAAGLAWSKPAMAQATTDFPFIGQIQTFAFNFAPRGWMFCNGQLLEIVDYTALFALIGTTYGGDGRKTFGLPDLRGRVAMGFGQGPGLSNRPIGQFGGAETVTLTTAQMPAHSHQARLLAQSVAGNNVLPTNAVLALATPIYSHVAPNVQMSADAIEVGDTGGGQAFNNMPPYQVINYSIALVGEFPFRN